MDDIALTKILTELQTQQTRIFDNLKEMREAVFETNRNVNQLTTDVAILKDNDLDKRVTNIEGMLNKIIGGLIILQIALAIIVNILMKLMFNQ